MVGRILLIVVHKVIYEDEEQTRNRIVSARVADRRESCVIVQRRHEPDAPLTKEMSEQLGRLAEKTDADINYSDIPELSDEQLAEFSHRHPSSRLLGGKLLAKVDKAS